MNDQRTTSIEDRPLPSPVAEQMQIALGVNEPPATLAEWADATTRLLEDAGITVGMEELCTVEVDRHEARIDDDVQCFRCVLDTLLVPFVLDEPDAVEIRSRSPVSGEVIEIRASQDSIDVTPDDAVMSFGVTADVQEPAEDDLNPALAYDRFCPYVNAFASRAEYDRWARETPEAVTTGLSMKDAHALARCLGERPLYD